MSPTSGRLQASSLSPGDPVATPTRPDPGQQKQPGVMPFLGPGVGVIPEGWVWIRGLLSSMALGTILGPLRPITHLF